MCVFVCTGGYVNLLSLKPYPSADESSEAKGGRPGFTLQDLNRFCSGQAEAILPFPFRRPPGKPGGAICWALMVRSTVPVQLFLTF